MDIEMSMVSTSKAGNVIKRAGLPHFGQSSPGLPLVGGASSGFWTTSFSMKSQAGHRVHSIQSIIGIEVLIGRILRLPSNSRNSISITGWRVERRDPAGGRHELA